MDISLVIAKLRLHEYRVTPTRLKILESLSKSPLSVQEIQDSLKQKNLKIDQATVYRTLHCLADIGVVTKTQFKDRAVKYELHSEAHHHHHLVCDSCGTVTDVSLNEAQLFKTITQKNQFKITTHSLEFFGVCAKCQ